MRLDKVRQTLKKVNALVDNLADQGATSSIEKDLLKRYLIDMYEEVTSTKAQASSLPVNESTASISQPVAIVVEKEEAPAPIAKPVSVIADQTTYYDAGAENESNNKVIAPVADAKINEFKDPVKYFPVETEPETPVGAESSAARPTVAQANNTTLSESPIEDIAEMEQRFAAIFSASTSQDLAGQFASGKIPSIDAAMGINQRLLTVNELFDGSMDAFNSAITKLNQFASFDEAKQFIAEGPADAYKWDSEMKQNTARDFVNIIRRKYD